MAKAAREEKARKRDAEMAKLYRKHVLKEADPVELVQIGKR